MAVVEAAVSFSWRTERSGFGGGRRGLVLAGSRGVVGMVVAAVWQWRVRWLGDCTHGAILWW